MTLQAEVWLKGSALLDCNKHAERRDEALKMLR